MSEGDVRIALVERLFAGTGPSYDFMVNAATLGIDALWKRRILARIPTSSRRILDLACGTGILTFGIARHFPEAQVTGVELRDEYLAIARDKARRRSASNVEFVLSRAEDYATEARFDCITSSYLAKYADLPRLLASNRAMLVDGGLVVMHDFILPPKPALLMVWRIYFRLLQLLGSACYPAWREIYYGLPELLERTRWLSELQELLPASGFTDVQTEYLTAYGSAIVTARKDACG